MLTGLFGWGHMAYEDQLSENTSVPTVMEMTRQAVTFLKVRTGPAELVKTVSLTRLSRPLVIPTFYTTVDFKLLYKLLKDPGGVNRRC